MSSRCQGLPGYRQHAGPTGQQMTSQSRSVLSGGLNYLSAENNTWIKNVWVQASPDCLRVCKLIKCLSPPGELTQIVPAFSVSGQRGA